MDINKIKTIFLGDIGVGKSSIINRIRNDSFSENISSTIGCEFTTYIYDNIKLMIWDTAGQELFRSFTPQFCRGANICIIVYDITNENTKNNIQTWLDLCEENTMIYIVGNKSDLSKNNNITKNNLTIYKLIDYKFKDLGIISAKSSYRINEILQIIIKDIKNKLNKNKLPIIQKISIDNESNSNNCCVLN